MIGYASAKAGVLNFIRALALELAPHNINVNCIIPGGIKTPMNEAHRKTLSPEKIKDLVPLGHLGEPEDIVKTTLFLVSDDAGFITGAALTVDGGELVRY